MNKSLDLVNGKVGKTLLKFSLPFLLSSLLQALYGIVDVFFIGKFASTAALSGVSSSSTIMTMITMLFLGLTSGGTVLMGQYYGAKKNREAADTVGSIILLFVVLSVVVTSIIVICASPLIRILNVPADAVSEAESYLRVCSFGIIFIMGYNIVSSILRGLGNSKTPMFFVVISCVINIILDYVFVGCLHMGAGGAALATVIAQAASLCVGIFYIVKVKFPFAFGWSNLRVNWPHIWHILKIGIPMSLQNTMISISFMLLTSIVNSMGLFASASVGVVNKLVDCSMMIPMSISNAITAMTAQNVGAGKPERAKRAMWLGIMFSLVFAVPYCILAMIWPEFFVGLLTNDPDVIACGALYLIPNAWDCVGVCFVFCLTSLFNGCGRSGFVLIQNLVTTFLIRIPMVWLFSRMADTNLLYVGLAMPIASAASIAICLVYLFKNFRGDKLARITAVR